jgi:hypothetical protein
VFVNSEVERANRRITELETRATETHSLLVALLDSVGGHREEEQEAPSGQQENYNGNHRKAAEPTNGTKKRYADAVGRNKPGNGGQEKTKSHVVHSEGKKDKTENYEEVRTGGATANPNSEVEEEGEMEELAGFKAITYKWYRRKQRQQVLTGTSSDSEIKAEKKKVWLYLGRMV